MSKPDKHILFLQHKIAYARDEQAYKELFYFFHPTLYRFAYNIIKDEDASEDIVSDLFIKIWQMEARLAYVENLKLYLLTAVKNACFTYLKSSKNNVVSLGNVETETLAGTTEEAAGKLNFSETALVIETAVKALPTNCRVIFRLIKEEGLSYKQVSAVLDISQNTIETQMHIALKRIRLVLDSYLQKK